MESRWEWKKPDYRVRCTVCGRMIGKGRLRLQVVWEEPPGADTRYGWVDLCPRCFDAQADAKQKEEK